jgi:hypothetical protein
MTPFEATDHLFKWFVKNDAYHEDDDYKNLLLIQENPNEVINKASILHALKSLAESHIAFQSGKYWILEKPLSKIDQNVSISGDMATMIAGIINSMTNDPKEMCNPFNVNGSDIYKLLLIINNLNKAQE